MPIALVNHVGVQGGINADRTVTAVLDGVTLTI